MSPDLHKFFGKSARAMSSDVFGILLCLLKFKMRVWVQNFIVYYKTIVGLLREASLLSFGLKYNSVRVRDALCMISQVFPQFSATLPPVEELVEDMKLKFSTLLNTKDVIVSDVWESAD